MSNLLEIETAVRSLPVAERTQFVDWMDEHRRELMKDHATPECEAVIAEVRRRREEMRAQPELAGTFDADYFNRLRRKAADAAGKTSAG